MCGIAGFNCTQEWSAEHLNNIDLQEQLLQDAWLYNLHRGYDASGFFALNLEEPSYRIFKKGEIATNVLTNDIFGKDIVVPCSTLGAHTRAPTWGAGSVKEPENNHPVNWKNAWVTHNGTISNDWQIKRQFEKNLQNRPDVDSVAITMLMSEIKDPTYDKEIVDMLIELNGDFAFHGIWEDNPGWSLFATSTEKPFVGAFNPEAGLFYASVPEAVFGMIERIGFDPNKNWDWFELQDYQYLVMKHGEPVVWGDYSNRRKFEDTATFTIARLLPNDEGDDPQIVYETDNKFDWAMKKGRKSMLGESFTTKELIYTRKHGPAESKNAFPRKTDSSIESVFSEADKIIQGDNGNLHVFFGNIEIVTTASRSVQDVFNHDILHNNERWASSDKREKIDPAILGHEVFDEFMIEFTETNGKRPKNRIEYQYVTDQKKKDKKKKNTGGQGKVLMPSTKNTKDGATNSTWEAGLCELEFAQKIFDEDDFSLVEPTVKLDWATAYDNFYYHETVPGMVFLANLRCPDHGYEYTQHPDPVSCEFTAYSASFALTALDGVDLWVMVDWNHLTIDWVMTEQYCNHGAEKGEDKCWWTTNEYFVVYGNQTKWEVPTGDICLLCGSTRRLDELPEWISYLSTSKRITKDVNVSVN